MRYDDMIRYNKLLPFLLLSFVITFHSCSEEEETVRLSTFETASEEIDISYGSDPLQTYDLYLPANRSVSETDVIILVHGGSWTGGDKDDIFGIVGLLQTTMPGYAIANINYRLTIDPDALFVDHIADVESVVLDIASRHEELGVSQDMVMAGVSAGGHMTLLYAYANNTNDYIKAAGNIIGPTFFLDPSYTSGTNPTFLATIASITTFTGVPVTDEEYYGRVSPLTFVSSNTIPTIQFLGEVDPLIPVTQGTLLQEALNQAGVANDLIIYEGEGHGWTDLNNWTDTAVRFRDFVEQVL